MKARLQHLATVAAVLGLCRPALAAPVTLDNPEAREHFERGQALFDAEDYAAAVPELKAAYALEPEPKLLYAWAQAERLAGDCRKAIALYRRFVESEPSPKHADLARANIVDCEAELAAAPAPPPDPEGESEAESEAEPEPEPEPEGDPESGPPPASDRPWHRDWPAGVLLGTGAAAAIAGGIVVGVSVRNNADSTQAPYEGQYFVEVDAARQLNVIGWSVLAVGGALLVGGAVRLAVLGKRHRRAKSTAYVLPSARGATLGWRF